MTSEMFKIMCFNKFTFAIVVSFVLAIAIVIAINSLGLEIHEFKIETSLYQ